MWMRLHRGLTLDAAGAPAGGAAAGDGTSPAGGSASAAPAPGGTGAAQPDAFNWATVGLAPDAHALVTERQWKHPNDVITSYRNLEKLTGVPADQIIKLPKGDDPKGWDAVYNRLGRPEKADGYQIPVPEGDKGEFAKVASEWFHEAGVTQAGAKKIAEKWNEFQAKQMQTYQEQTKARDTTEVTELKKAWGADYDKHAALVDKAAETFGMTKEHLSALKEVMGPKAAMEFMQKIGAKIGVEDTQFHDGTQQSGFNGMTPEMARAEIDRLRMDKSFSQEFNSADPRVRSEARSRMARLAQIAAPGVQEFPGWS